MELIRILSEVLPPKEGRSIREIRKGLQTLFNVKRGRSSLKWPR